MKSIDYVNIIVSKKKELPKELVATINKEYWKEVKRRMNDLEVTSLYIKKIGTFSISRFLLNKKIFNTLNLLKAVPNNKRFTEPRKEQIIKVVKARLTRLLFQRNIIAKIYYERFKRIHESASKNI